MRSSGTSWSFDVAQPENFDVPNPSTVHSVEAHTALQSQQREWDERQARQDQRDAMLDEREAQLVQRIEDADQQLLGRRAKLESDCRTLSARAAALQAGEEQLHLDQIARDSGFTEERQQLLDEQRERYATLEAELSDKRVQAYARLEAQLSQERDARLGALEQELADLRRTQQQRLEQSRMQWEALRDEQKETLSAQVQALEERDVQVKSQQSQVRRQELELNARANALEEDRLQLGDAIDEGMRERRNSFETSEKRLHLECERLRAALDNVMEQMGAYKQLKLEIGEDPQQLFARLTALAEENRVLGETLRTRPGEEVLIRLSSLQDQKDTLLRENEQLTRERDALRDGEKNHSDLLFQVQSLEAMNGALHRRTENKEAEVQQQHAELMRLKGGYQRDEDRAKRIELIQVPVFKQEQKFQVEPLDELQWLEGIAKACENHGLRFSRRILHTFHTCLKTAEWSPLTVLAGVSGTGKSQLPKLYTHFGGIHFLSLPVQPTWDSSQSLLGFFNTLDNSFDAQPLLRLLVQMQQPEMKDSLSLVLLDEMNLAHVELYFAEFLSRLEDRRGIKGDDVPCLTVPLGARVEPYEVPLSRNVLWAGTMNQDETTKSLSDKVIDRGFMIHFPSPERFERRSELKPLPEPAALLRRKTWNSWCVTASAFTEQQIAPYLELMEKINSCLRVTGRSMGHRVWQSMEYYMANYPDVIQALSAGESDSASLQRAMKVAFEDQLALKVMPKLRGIETRGKSRTECLDVVQTLLDERGFALVSDFRRACEVGYGQFIWSSADYLKSGSDEK